MGKKQGQKQKGTRRSERLKIRRARRMNHPTTPVVQYWDMDFSKTDWPPNEKPKTKMLHCDYAVLIKILHQSPMFWNDIVGSDYWSSHISKILRAVTNVYYSYPVVKNHIRKLRVDVIEDRLKLEIVGDSSRKSHLACRTMELFELADDVFKRVETSEKNSNRSRVSAELQMLDISSIDSSSPYGRKKRALAGRGGGFNPRKKQSSTSSHESSADIYTKSFECVHALEHKLETAIYKFAKNFSLGCPNFAMQVVNHRNISEEELLSFLNEKFVEYEKYGHNEFGERMKSMAA